MTRFTKGPWNCSNPEFIKDKNGLHIALIGTSRAVSDTGPQMEANARLIAAAPDMFEALELAREVLKVACGETAPYIKQAFTKIDPALAKARGET